MIACFLIGVLAIGRINVNIKTQVDVFIYILGKDKMQYFFTQLFVGVHLIVKSRKRLAGIYKWRVLLFSNIIFKRHVEYIIVKRWTVEEIVIDSRCSYIAKPCTADGFLINGIVNLIKIQGRVQRHIHGIPETIDIPLSIDAERRILFYLLRECICKQETKKQNGNPLDQVFGNFGRKVSLFA